MDFFPDVTESVITNGVWAEIYGKTDVKMKDSNICHVQSWLEARSVARMLANDRVEDITLD